MLFRSGYYDCEDLGNLRGMCERQERLDYKNPLNITFSSNFCQPADAGIIKSSIKIHKLIEQFRKETSLQFTMTVIMTFLVIILTVINLYLTL